MINTTQNGVRSVKIADIDNDGDNDNVVMINQASGTDEIVWYSNEDGIGSIWTAFSIDSSSTEPREVTIGDFDLDSNVDIAAITHEAADISGIAYITDVDKEEVEKILTS